MSELRIIVAFGSAKVCAVRIFAGAKVDCMQLWR